MRWTKEQYAEWLAKQNRAGDSGLRAAEQKQPAGQPLERALPRKTKGGNVATERARIEYTVFAVRPPDYDNAWTKCLTDCLVAIGWIRGDDWWLLHGGCTCEKAHDKAEEKTVIEITW